jgi:hypothetical protein
MGRRASAPSGGEQHLTVYPGYAGDAVETPLDAFKGADALADLPR